MKNLKKLWLGLCCCAWVMCLIGCGNSSDAETLFSKEFCDEIIGINYIDFDGGVCITDDEELLNQLKATLSDNHYNELKEEDYIEGGYQFTLVTEKKAYEISISDCYISWQGKQYESEESFSGFIEEVKNHFDIE